MQHRIEGGTTRPTLVEAVSALYLRHAVRSFKPDVATDAQIRLFAGPRRDEAKLGGEPAW
jgi:hypothetical protein